MSRRLFFALWPEPDMAAALHRFARTLEPDLGRAPAMEDLHVTLCFLGSVADASLPALTACIGGIRAAPFELTLDRVEYWQRSRVLVLGCRHPPRAAALLAGAVRACAPLVGTRLERAFEPHLTLIRGLPAAGERPPSAPVAQPFVLAARKFHLAESQPLESGTESASMPPRYRCLAEWPLH